MKASFPLHVGSTCDTNTCRMHARHDLNKQEFTRMSTVSLRGMRLERGNFSPIRHRHSSNRDQLSSARPVPLSNAMQAIGPDDGVLSTPNRSIGQHRTHPSSEAPHPNASCTGKVGARCLFCHVVIREGHGRCIVASPSVVNHAVPDSMAAASATPPTGSNDKHRKEKGGDMEATRDCSPQHSGVVPMKAGQSGRRGTSEDLPALLRNFGLPVPPPSRGNDYLHLLLPSSSSQSPTAPAPLRGAQPGFCGNSLARDARGKIVPRKAPSPALRACPSSLLHLDHAIRLQARRGRNLPAKQDSCPAPDAVRQPGPQIRARHSLQAHNGYGRATLRPFGPAQGPRGLSAVRVTD